MTKALNNENKSRLANGICQQIAGLVGTHYVYVAMVLRGERPANKGKALQIMNAYNAIQEKNNELAAAFRTADSQNTMV
jgi:hypothetical protein